MALIDLKTNLAKLKNVDNIDNVNQDGFTPNRKTKSPTLFKKNTSQLGTGENVDYVRRDLSIERVSNAESNYDKFQPDDGQLIQKEVGERYRNTKNDGGLFRGGIALQTERTIEDAQRVGKFLGTGKGRIFTLKQLFLQSKNGDKRTNIYNPLSTILSLPNNVSQQRHLDKPESFGGFLLSLFGLNEGQRYETSRRIEKEIEKDSDGTFKRIGGNVEATNFFNVKSEGSRNLQVSYGGDRGELKKLSKGGKDLPKDFIKFRIRDAVNGRWIIFPALINGITDNSSHSPTTINYIGRPDSVYVYGTMDRTIGFNLRVVALNKDDIETIWEKVNYLKGLVQPQFKQFFTDNEDTKLLNPNDINTRPVAPIIYLTIGDMFVNTPGFFKSVNVTIPDNVNWELDDNLQFPHICDIALDFQYIGKETPTMLGKNYEGKVGEKVVERRTPPNPPEETTTTETGAS